MGNGVTKRDSTVGAWANGWLAWPAMMEKQNFKADI